MRQPPAPRSRPRALVRGLLSLGALLLLVLGVPVLLWQIGTLPDSIPSPAALLAPDDGTLLLTAMTVMAWGAWLWLTVPVLIEVVAVLAQRTTPRLPGMATGQKLAGFLLGSILLASPAAAAAATPAVAASAPQAVDAAAAGGEEREGTKQEKVSEAAAPAAPASATPVEPVALDAEATWWELAEEHLGDGSRYAELQRLNPGLPADSVLPAGTVVQVPGDSIAAGGPRVQLAAAEKPAETEDRIVEVAAGDTLWGIAEEELGDGTKYGELYEASRSRPQPDGLPRLSSPDLIQPGQEIAVPVAEDAPAPPDRQTPEKPVPPPEEPDAEAEKPAPKSPSSPDKTSPAPSTPAAEKPSPAPSTSAPDRAPETETPRTPAPGQSDGPAPAETSDQGDDSSTIGVVGLVASGVFAAGIVGTLGARRLLRRRGLRRGKRLAMPTGSAADAERALRSVDASVELHLLDSMLRALALHLAEEDTEAVLPDLIAARLGEPGVMLYLAEPAAPVAPFTADGPTQGGASSTWWCPADTDQLPDAERLREVDPPYPGLLALGTGADDSLVLVDMEGIGALHLTGSRRHEVLRMAAITLALSPLGGQIELAVASGDTAPGLQALDAQRVRPHADLASAVAALNTHHTGQLATLTAGGTDSLSRARLDADIEELPPLVLIADLDACPDPDRVKDGWALLDQSPSSALAALTGGADEPADAEVWTADTDAEEVTIPGTDLLCSLSGCTDTEYADVLALVQTADLPLQPDPDSDPALIPQPQQAPEEPEEPDVSPESVPQQAPAEPPVASVSTEKSAASTEEAPDGATAEKSAGEQGAESEPPSPAPAIELPETREGAEVPAARPVPAAPALPRVSVRLPEPETAVAVPDADPVVRVLGPVALTGARGQIQSNRETVALELAAWLVLHPGATSHQIDEVLAPNGRSNRDTRNSRLRELRKWLGEREDGTLYLPLLASQPDRRFRLQHVTCDWDAFQNLAADHTGDLADRQERLHRALDLVRGRPFSGIPARRYSWSEDIVQEIITAVVHVADELADLRLRESDGRGALWAATRGLQVAREAEQLWRQRFRAHALLGEERELEAAIRSMEAMLLDLGYAMEAETSDTLRLLQMAKR
ncbi:LysM peptidoglycan-binding domain-containing protein [Streptomyces albidoflavus]|uniref:LysM peptidoglycan-binding domain-containing protein n=1 Tax=Streptomyces albidoflavus TaxID=1886 RepID=UPI00340C8239